jgi:hypothetical protein
MTTFLFYVDMLTKYCSPYSSGYVQSLFINFYKFAFQPTADIKSGLKVTLKFWYEL